METLYYVSIWLILLLGVAHAGFTFKKFHKMSPEALWFFSTAIGLICSGLINYINLKFPNPSISNIALAVNLLQLLFAIVLVFNVRQLIIYIAVVLTSLIFLSSIGFYLITY